MYFRVPFSFYDVASYLSAGFILLFALHEQLETSWMEWEHLTAADGFFLIIIVYLLGHLVSQVASILYEDWLLRWLGRPSEHLFKEKSRKWPAKYTRPLPEVLRNQVLAKYARYTDSKHPGESMFLYCFHKVKGSSPATDERLMQFLSIYGFARNMSLVLLIIAGVEGAKLSLSITSDWSLLAGSLAGTWILLNRFLKYYRLYSMEIFASFAVLKE